MSNPQLGAERIAFHVFPWRGIAFTRPFHQAQQADMSRQQGMLMSDSSQPGRSEALLNERSTLINQMAALERQGCPSTYGAHDPFTVELAACEACTSQPRLRQLTTGNRAGRWQVRCPCCARCSGAPNRQSWIASLVWNGINLRSQDYRDLPLFDLGDRAPPEAHEHIRMIRAYLVLRLSVCDLDWKLHTDGHARRKPGSGFRVRLEAYLQWAMLAHRLIKVAQASAAQ